MHVYKIPPLEGAGGGIFTISNLRMNRINASAHHIALSKGKRNILGNAGS